MSLSVFPQARTTPPPLNDPSKYVRVPNVPIFTKHVRKLVDPQTKEVRVTSVDDDQLKVICENTNKKVQKGENPLIFLGHRTIKDPRTGLPVPETNQPPLIGYIGRNQIGIFNGEPAIIAELFIKSEYKESLEEFPRRSAEVWGKESPNGYIDALALLKTIPELDLGLLTHYRKENPDIEIFECQCQEKFSMSENSGSKRADSLARDEELGTENTRPESDEPDENSETEPDENEDSETDKQAMEAFSKAVAPHLAEHLSKHKGFHKGLAKHLAPHIADHLGKHEQFHKSIGEHVANHMAENPKHHDGLIKRISDLLEDASGHEDTEREEAEHGDATSPGEPEGRPEETPEHEETENHAAGGGAGMPSGTNTFVPGPESKGKNMENLSKDPNIAIAQLTVRCEKLEKALKDVTDKNAQLEAFNKQVSEEARTVKRRARLESLAENVELDVNEKLEQFSKFDDETFEMFAKDIEKNYARRIPIDQRPIQTAHLNGLPKSPAAKMFNDELTELEVKDRAVENFARENNIPVESPSDGLKIVNEYFKRADRSKYIGRK